MSNPKPDNKDKENVEQVEDITNTFVDINSKIASGQTIGAKRALTSSWRDSVPELPIRFAVILVGLNKDNIREIVKRSRKNKTSPKLKLVWENNKIEVWTSQGKKLHLGNLPSSDALMLLDLGTKAKRYKPKFLELDTDDSGEVDYLAIELVRPESNTDEANAMAMVSALENLIDQADGEPIDLGLEPDEEKD